MHVRKASFTGIPENVILFQSLVHVSSYFVRIAALYSMSCCMCFNYSQCMNVDGFTM